MSPWDDDQDDGYDTRVGKPAQRTLDGETASCLLPGCGHRLGDHRNIHGHGVECYRCKGDRYLHSFCATPDQVAEALDSGLIG